MAKQPSEEKKENFFSTSTLIFVIPAYIYLCSYAFEKGICSYYDIPEEFIKPDLTTNLYYSISLFVIVITVYYVPHGLFNSIFSNILKKRPETYSYFSANTLLFIMFFAYSRIAPFQIDALKTLYFYLAILPFVNLLAYWSASYFKRRLETEDYDTIARDWIAQTKSEYPIFDSPDVLNFRLFFRGINIRQRTILFNLVGLVVLSYFVGQGEAYRKTNYELSDENKGFVLLRKYGDDVIMKNITVKNQIGDSLIILKAGENNAQTFISKETGHLYNSKFKSYLPSF